MSILFILLILSSCTSLVFCANDDRLTLLKIKEQLGNPYFLSSWVDGFDYCNDSSAIYTYIECTSTGRVTTLSIGYHYYLIPNYAVFPEAICDLTELEDLYFAKLWGIGPLPSCINNLTNLRQISIWKSSLWGSIPELDKLSKLTRINLEENRLSGLIPQSLSKLPNLQYLNLRNNYFSGSIPPGLLHYHPDAELNLSDNDLTGEIPRCYGWQNFSYIDLAGNNLTGDASFLFGKHKTVTSIDLSFNQFQFDLSNVEIPENLTFLDLKFNRIYGKVPDSIASTPNLFVDLMINGLCGIFPLDYWTHSPFTERRTHWKGTYDLDGCLCGNPLPPCNNSAPASAPVLAP